MYSFFKETTISDFSDASITELYAQGFVATRPSKYVFHQLNSVRILLDAFEPNSENRRMLRKSEDLEVQLIPLGDFEYSWEIGKLAKDFYDTKFEPGLFSANKIKELFTDPEKSAMNAVFVYTQHGKTLGYCLALVTNDIIHYSYPFYDLSEVSDNSMGMYMMVQAIMLAKAQGKKYIYLGSYKRYKMQFDGVEIYTEDKGWLGVKKFKIKNDK